MNWIKRGKIFDPTQHALSNGCIDFAQSPQALICDSFVRVYFSTRARDPRNGKFLSHISYVDYSNSMDEIIDVSRQTVIPLGGLGAFDEHGIFPISPLRVGEQVYAYTTGWSRRVSVSVETGIGLAISDDTGKTFVRHGSGPVMGPILNEPVLVGDAFVIQRNGRFDMWYIFGTKWIEPSGNEPSARVYKIAYASSVDGIEWVRNGDAIITDVLDKDECQALPTVLKIGERWHMYFCYREATDFRSNAARGYRLGYAFSEDGRTWTRDDDNSGIDISIGGFDSTMMCYPHIFENAGRVFLLYNGNDFGRYGFGLAELEQD